VSREIHRTDRERLKRVVKAQQRIASHKNGDGANLIFLCGVTDLYESNHDPYCVKKGV
jgi:hypothetical protein